MRQTLVTICAAVATLSVACPARAWHEKHYCAVGVNFYRAPVAGVPAAPAAYSYGLAPAAYSYAAPAAGYAYGASAAGCYGYAAGYGAGYSYGIPAGYATPGFSFGTPYSAPAQGFPFPFLGGGVGGGGGILDTLRVVEEILNFGDRRRPSTPKYDDKEIKDKLADMDKRLGQLEKDYKDLKAPEGISARFEQLNNDLNKVKKRLDKIIQANSLKKE